MQGGIVQESPKIENFQDSNLLELGLDALWPEAILWARKLACSVQPEPSWARLSDGEALEHLGLVSPARAGHPCKLTVAALLLFGRREVIHATLPGRHVEVTAQLLDPEGYDYKERYSGNLLESLVQLETFTAENFPEGERVEGQRPNFIRDVLFREIFTNILVHRDYSIGAPSRLVFQKERMTFENPGKPRRGGIVDLAWRESHPKNPLIYRFFKEIGLMHQSGHGMETLLRYGEAYFGTRILAFDRDIFKVIVTSNLEFPVQREIVARAGPADSDLAATMQDERRPVSARFPEAPAPRKFSPITPSWHHPGIKSDDFSTKTRSMQAESVSMQDEVEIDLQSERVRKILALCETPRNREEIQKHVGLNNRDHFRKEVLLPLLRHGVLLATIPDKPNSPKQQYRTAPGVPRKP